MKYIIIIVITINSMSLIAQNDYEVYPNKLTNEKTERENKTTEFIRSNFPYVNIADWHNGMRFLVEKSSSMLAEMKLAPYKKSGLDGTKLYLKDFVDKIFTVEGVEERTVKCPKGECKRTYVIFILDNKKYEYELMYSKNELRQSETIPQINNFIYIDEIDKARSILIGKEFYLLDNTRIFNNHKFIPVKIINIGIGNTISSSPVKIIYSTENGKEYSVSLKLSGINSYKLMGSLFYEVFSMDDPKNDYPEISDEVWYLIQNKKVVVGMNEKECELAWGKPNKINNTITNGIKYQQWVYNTNAYLYFEDGKLVTIQN